MEVEFFFELFKKVIKSSIVVFGYGENLIEKEELKEYYYYNFFNYTWNTS